MPRAGAHTLRDACKAGETHVRIACADCSRLGRYAVLRLLQAHGDIAMPDLLALLTEGCPKRIAAKPFDRCKATFDQRNESPGAGLGIAAAPSAVKRH